MNSTLPTSIVFKQYYLACLSHASYLLADPECGQAVVVDPQRDIDAYLEDAEHLGVTITHVFLTHFHADFLAGHLELQERTGCALHVGAAATAEYAFVPAHDGDEVKLGKLRIRILETPGHTPESICLLVNGDAVLTGDTLFVGDVGRPDLLASVGVSARDLAVKLHDSIFNKLLTLPDEVRIYPAHGAGSMCGRSLSTELFSTIGQQRLANPTLKLRDTEAFVAAVTAEQSSAPGYFLYDARRNRERHTTLDHLLEGALQPLSWSAFRQAQEAGAQVVDVRDAEMYAQGHVKDSTNVGLSGKFATWAGAVLSPDRPLVIVADAGREKEAMTRLFRIGYDQIQGYLAESAPPTALRQTPRLTPEEARQRLPGVLYLDVRSEREWQSGHAPHSLNVPLQRLQHDLDSVPADRPLLVGCQSGYRSSIAASILRQVRTQEITDLAGGFVAWQAAFPDDVELA
ncbi:MAG TPA: MBL fold metallo-hydrolase [Candidatus Xenobia bacterium]|jgi:glyoxylase-like metal-dependent hydrolase (beta-lactamase superfamily II)/rhodanese-related sulfurtransferase